MVKIGGGAGLALVIVSGMKRAGGGMSILSPFDEVSNCLRIGGGENGAYALKP